MTNKFGRLFYKDERDKRYTFRLAIVNRAPFWRLWRFWTAGPTLDQGDTPMCVGYSWRQWLSSAPLMTPDGPTPPEIYNEAQLNDEWTGINYDGTSVRGGAKTLDIRGHIANYLWAESPESLKTWILTKGPVVVGTNWYTEMSNPDTNGVVKIAGHIAGGHAYIIIGYNSFTKRYRCINSWGTAWGQSGRFWISEDDMHRLIFNEDGEACAAVEQAIVIN